MRSYSALELFPISFCPLFEIVDEERGEDVYEFRWKFLSSI